MVEDLKGNFATYVKERKIKVINYVKSSEFKNNLIFVLVLIAIRLFALGNYAVPTGSMNPTILEGDKFFSNKLQYSLKMPFTKWHPLRWGIPKRGDIIAFIYPADEKFDFTKRVVGLPGDKIMIKGHDLIINGKVVPKKKIAEDDDFIYYRENLYGVEHIIQHEKNTTVDFSDKEFIVPENNLFAMGDNRDNSLDSRYWGYLPIENVTGKLVFRWMSWVPGHPLNIRWNRIGLDLNKSFIKEQ